MSGPIDPTDPQPEAPHSTLEEHWDYAEDLERAQDELDALEDDEELEDQEGQVDDEELDEDDDDDDEEGIAASPPSGGKGPWIWMAAAAAWAGVMLFNFTGDSTEPAGPQLAVQQGDAAAGDDPEASVERAPVDEQSEPDPAEDIGAVDAAPEPPSKIKLVRGPGGRWWNPDWDKDLTAPEEVLYTVKRGGSIKFIANLYKIFHHEIQAWNPGLPLDKELGPGTKVVVYKKPQGEVSESLGLATRGQLVGGVPMLPGPGRQLKHTPWKGFATGMTVAVMDKALTAWSERGSAGKPVQPVLVGNMSARKGGRLPPHGSHQSGRDVDLSYVQKGPDTADLNWREMHAKNLDAGETWRLLETLVATGAVQNIYIDTGIQKLLHEYAVANQLVTKRDLATWLEYPRSVGSANSIVKHVRGHKDHIHVRFACPASQSRCQSK